MSKIKITILGTTAGVPTKERAHAAIHFSYKDREEYCCLFDCGEGTQRQFLYGGLSMMKIDEIFITHWHGDHCLGLPGFLDTMGFEGRLEAVTVFAPNAKRVKALFQFGHSIGKFKVIPQKVPVRGECMKKIFAKERFEIFSIPVRHSIPAVAYAFIEKDKRVIDMDKAAKLGFPEKGEIFKKLKAEGKTVLDGKEIYFEDVSHIVKGRKIVYSGDTEICPNLEKFIRDADLLIQDCTYFDKKAEKKPYKHASFPEILKMVRENNVKRTILTHIGRKYRDRMDEIRDQVSQYEGFEIAEDFLQVEI